MLFSIMTMISMLIFAFCIVLISSSYSFWTMWLGLEVMNFFLIPWLVQDSGKYKSSKIFFYFIIQSFTSGIFLLMIMLPMMKYSFFFILMSMIMKMGSFPFHMWVIMIVEGMSWHKFTFLLTWAKSGSLIILFLINPMFMLIYPTLGGMLIPLMGLKKNSLRKMLAYSSISHISWVIITMCLSKSLFLVYIFLYWLSFTLASLIFDMFKVSSLITYFYYSNSWMLNLMIILNLMGYPPFLGFFPKLMTLKMLFLHNQVTLATIVSIISLIPVFFYLKMIISMFLTYELKNLSFMDSKTYMSNKSYYLWLIITLYMSLDIMFIISL